MLSDWNLFPRTNELRRFCVAPHTPLRTLLEGSVIRALVGHDDERHCRIRSIGEAELVAADIERIDSSPFERILRLEEGGTTLEHLVQVEGTEVEYRVDGDIRLLAAHDSRHSVHVSKPSFETVERLAVDEVRLVQNEDVRERDLLGALVASPQLLLDVGCIDERDDPVKRELRANLVVHEEGLSDRTGIGEPCGLHQHIVELVAALHEVAEHANQVSAHRAADAAVRHLEDLFVSVDDERLIDADLSVLVLDHGNALAVLLTQDPVEQGRLARAEEAGEDGYRYFLRSVHLVLLGQRYEHWSLAPCPVSRAPLVLVISERNVITLYACGAIEINVMTLPSIQPRPCADSNCRGQHAPAERVSAESEDPRVERLLGEDAAVLGFRVTRRVVEAEGTCGSCIAAGPA